MAGKARSEVTKSLRRVTTNYARLFLTLGLGIAEVIVLLKWMGPEAFGLISLLGGTMGLVGIVREIISQSMIRELGAAFHSGDRAHFLRTYHACYVIAVRTTIFSAALFAGLIYALPHILNISPDLMNAAYVFATASAISACLFILCAPTFNMYVVRERFAFQNAWLVARRGCFPVTAILFWLVMPDAGPDEALIVYALVANIASFVLLLLPVAAVWKRDAELFPRANQTDRQTIRDVMGTFGWNSGVIFSMSMAERIPILFVNWYFGLFGNAVYGVAWRLGAYARMITVGSTFGLEAVTTRISSATDGAARIPTFIRHTTRLHSWVAFPAGFALAILAEALLTLWVGRSVENPEEVIPVAIPVTQAVVVAMTTRGISEGWIRILYGDGHVRQYAPLVIIASIAIPLLTWLAAETLPPPLDFNSPALAYAFVSIVAYVFLLPLWGARILGLRARNFVTPMLRPALVTLASAPALIVAKELGVLDSLLGLFVAAAVFGLVYFGLSLVFVISPDERARALALIRALRQRGSGGPLPQRTDPSHEPHT
ncbi:MAG: hypothetical protein ACF8SC_08365 [Phycisphaerales bacterium JB037]